MNFRCKALKRATLHEVMSDVMRNGLISAIILISALLLLPEIMAFQNGVDSSADNGCLCHGIADDSTIIAVDGMPEKWESNVTYPLVLSLQNNQTNTTNSNVGGFRLLISGGELSYNSDLIQELDSGFTHTSNGSKVNSWAINWTSPTDATKTVHFKIFCNAVNGDGTNNGDAWSKYEITIPGAEYTPTEISGESPSLIEYSGLLVIVLGIVLLVKLMYSKPEHSGKQYEESIDEFN